MNALLIAGTDCQVGKTVLLSALAAYWQSYYAGRSLGILKPVQAGGGDRDLYQRLFSLPQTVQEITPIHFEQPIAPPLAARETGQRIDLAQVWDTFENLARQKDWVLIEAFGGLGSPLTEDSTVADLAWDWRIPTVLVVPVRLGCIGQAIAHTALARESRIHLKGIVLNCVSPCTLEEANHWAPVRLIQKLTGVPVLGTIPHLEDPTNLAKLAHVASSLEVERLVPMSLWR